MSDRYVPTPVGFARSSKEPLDKYETFNSIIEMKNYIATGSVYPGQVCKVNFGNDLLLEYLMKKNSSGNIRAIELYPDPIEKNIMLNSEYTNYGYTTNIATASNASSFNYWQLVYSHESALTYSSANLYNSNPYDFSTLCNLELYNNSGINLLIAINDEIKYRWKQTNNFVLSASSNSSGVCISGTANAKYIYPLLVNGTDSGYGLFPKTAEAAKNCISLYVSIQSVR